MNLQFARLTSFVLKGFQIPLIIFMSTHWVGCIFFFLSRAQGFSKVTWIQDFAHIYPLYNFEHSTVQMDYFVCIYKGLNQLSNLAYDLGKHAQIFPYMVC